MTNRELRAELEKYPDDTIIELCPDSVGYLTSLDTKFTTYKEDGKLHLIMYEKDRELTD